MAADLYVVEFCPVGVEIPMFLTPGGEKWTWTLDRALACRFKNRLVAWNALDSIGLGAERGVMIRRVVP